MRLPADWTAARASGWSALHHLIHTPCGFRTSMAYDLILDGPFGANDARQVVYGHTCEDGDRS
ncbi:hypothetical protein [Nocardia farcinica]|uniref:Uncharacterized protein n=1 Tax=Nocardia farcinica (strain IFM 10152) TaxID=247156 RepID=Q5YSK9_NOCFA|nr:hypothetical protein [Nocardia farcinica]BAD58832.1 hypothetical protein NFA_39840 [Nocardia farcinica IFM 10152]